MRKRGLFLGIIVVFFVMSRWVQLTKLPVFADEAIYIRWAQLIRQDFGRWVFYPMQDGKPPLFMIVLSKTLFVSADPLWASRVTSGFFGLVNLLLLIYLVIVLGGGWSSRLMAGGLYLVLPFSLFHDRMGLIDTMFVTWLLLSFIGLTAFLANRRWRYAVLGGLGLGLALWTKTSALFVPIIYALIVLTRLKPTLDREQRLILAGAGLMMAMGIGMFLSLKFSPVFPSLLSRSKDFSYPVEDVLRGNAHHIRGNAIKISRWLVDYLTIGLLLLVMLPLLGRWKWPYRIQPVQFWLPAVFFCLPFVFFGKVIASRYFLPLLVFLIPLGALSWEQLLKRRKDWAGLVGLTIVAQALYFGVPLITQPSTTPFASEDVEQYLTEWSAGYGNAEVRDLIQKKASQGKVVVATEGYFGTLPDGLLMYFDRSPLIDNVEIFGIGQPIRMLPEVVGEKAKSMDTYVLVNEHRLLFDPSGCCELVERYPRPRNGPALLLFKVEATDAGV